MKTVTVIGGGITGLCTMYYLQKQLKEKNVPARLILLEKNPYLGGKMHTARENGFIMETGADSIVARYPSVQELIKELDFESEVVYNETGISYIHTNNELHAIPKESVFGIPMTEESLKASTLISEEAKQRVLQEKDIPNTKFTKESSIGEFLEYFLGKEIVEKQIAPVLAGVYSGDIYQLSIASTLPYLVDYKNEYGSIMKGLEANREKFEREANKKFLSFKNGLSQLFERMEELLEDVEIYKNTETVRVEKKDGRYEIALANGEKIEADIVVLALPNKVIKNLLNNEELNPYFDQFKDASVITMYLGFDLPDSILPQDGTGFIVSHNSDLTCNASTWTSRKWKHTSKDGNLLVRVFYKESNPRYPELIKMSDEELTKVALNDIKLSLNIEAQPKVVKITKWIEAMPTYDLAHHEAVQQVLTKLEELYPNLFIAGCSYFGVGIGACIDNGKEIANKIANMLEQ
ncbi:protoporphyrinogen oxidase [Ureibacillus sp. FSL K6-8385]|uniref:Coproporphyrinogen III oxidase n=1 Tax=Ureibacillus terrenus TaxID=118246 RepID=A0A540UY73_9BACL|nr:protoporphyrinogen oxidase [Ureibacillus terrenus]MED3762838.1 protoporphyrinogen oxidase [Ureibacillus terrenus]TQE89432.1 protoporphyrinogen oxidase [Ureibacillus terrenus]